MGSPRLNLSFGGVASPEARVFRALQQVLASDPVLQSIGLKIRAWEDITAGRGLPLDSEKNAPAPADLPLIQLAPASNPARWETEGQHGGTFRVDLILYVAGTHADDTLNLWHAVRWAIFPQDPDRRATVDAVFAAIPECVKRAALVAQAAQVVALVGEEAYATKSAGAVVFTLYINT